PRASRVDPSPRERSGHGAPGAPRLRNARRASGVARVPAQASRALHLGRDAGGGGTPRGNSRISARGGRSDNARGRRVMALLRIPEQDRTISGPDAIAAYLAPHGITYECCAADPAVPVTASADELLAAYAPKIDALKAAGGYVTADVIDVNIATP